MATTLTSHWYRSWGPSPQRRLHWYVLPPEELRSTAARTQEAVARPELTSIPGPWLHCTVLSVRNADEVSNEDRATLLSSGQDAVRTMVPFTTNVGRPAVWGEAVVFDLSPTPALDDVHRAMVSASSAVLAGPAPTKYTPHITFSYAHAEAEAEDTARILSDPALVLPSFHVDRVYLLDVLREPGPEKGWYSWDVIGEAELLG